MTISIDVEKNHVTKFNTHTVFPVVTYGCESWTVRKAEH